MISALVNREGRGAQKSYLVREWWVVTRACSPRAYRRRPSISSTKARIDEKSMDASADIHARKGSHFFCRRKTKIWLRTHCLLGPASHKTLSLLIEAGEKIDKVFECTSKLRVVGERQGCCLSIQIKKKSNTGRKICQEAEILTQLRLSLYLNVKSFTMK